MCTYWATPFKIHTPLYGKLTIILPQRECVFQINQHVEQIYLKVSPLLCNILVKSTMEGVRISCRSIHWANPLGTDTPPVESVW